MSQVSNINLEGVEFPGEEDEEIDGLLCILPVNLENEILRVGHNEESCL